MGYISEYVTKGMSPQQLENELDLQIKRYRQKTNTPLFLYSVSFEKRKSDISISEEDYYIIKDIINDINSKEISIYIETPGGDGTAAEEIVKALRKKFDKVSFIISGEAKSAGTIIALSGDEIYMTDTGSLGPIDAQVYIGEKKVSAYDYMEWMREVTKRVETPGNDLNQVEATIIAQISPGELRGVDNALEFAKDLIVEWLPKYKFKNWDKTETRNILVTPEHKIKRAREIAEKLVNHGHWRTHARSIKYDDLKELLKINRVDDDPELADIIYRIQTILKLLFQVTTIYKLFITEHEKIFKNEAVTQISGTQPNSNDVFNLDINCPQCNQLYRFYAKTVNDPNIDNRMQSMGYISILENRAIKCQCGNIIQMDGIIMDFENQIKKKLV